jgi:hypothetical protein
MPFVVLAKITASMYDPAPRPAAEPLIDTVTVALCPLVSVPPIDERVTHA